MPTLTFAVELWGQRRRCLRAPSTWAERGGRGVHELGCCRRRRSCLPWGRPCPARQCPRRTLATAALKARSPALRAETENVEDLEVDVGLSSGRLSRRERRNRPARGRRAPPETRRGATRRGAPSPASGRRTSGRTLIGAVRCRARRSHRASEATIAAPLRGRGRKQRGPRREPVKVATRPSSAAGSAQIAFSLADRGPSAIERPNTGATAPSAECQKDRIDERQDHLRIEPEAAQFR